ncbi:MAG: NADH:quinone oxidoreductase [Sulfitobacter sp.]
MSCPTRSWVVAGIAGLIVMVLLMSSGGWSFFPAFLAGLLLAVVAGLLIIKIWCKQSTNAGSRPAAAAAPAPVATTPAPVAAASGVAAATATKPVDAEPDTPVAAKPAAKKPAAKKPAAKKPAAKSTAAKTAPAKAAAAKKTTAKKPAAKSAVKPVAADGKPALLTAARAGGADDLKLISGVGPKLEATLNELGFYHFDQIAGWRKKEVEWVDARLKFKGRIARDNWMAQAKILAKGGETEFSARKKK